MDEDDKENPVGDNWEYGAPYIGAEDGDDLEFCPFCEDFVETRDGICVECGYRIPSRGKAKRKERIRIKPDVESSQYCYRKGQELFKDGKSGKDWFRKAIALDSTSYWAYYSYYYLGREDLKSGNLKKAEDNFKTALSGIQDAEWLYYRLGKTLLLKGDFTEVESAFTKALKINPNLELARTYIDEIKLRKTKLEFPKKVREVEKLTENVMLENHALLEWFEMNMREFIKTVLEKEYGDKWWWRRGVPEKVRKDIKARKEESPEEEMDYPELSFAQFYNYVEIITFKENKGLFKAYIDPKNWTQRLKKLESIRNGIMHCRGRYLSNDKNLFLKDFCYDLEEIMKKVNKDSGT